MEREARDGARLRVARVITRLNVGGPAIQALLLTARLDPGRYESRLYAGMPGEREGDIRALRGDLGVQATVLRDLRREISPLADARAVLRLTREFRRFRPQIVHTHLAKAGVVGRIAARIARVPILIHTFHGTVLRGYFDAPRAWTFLQLERALARVSTRVVAISPGQAVELRALGIATPPRLIEIPLGLDLVPFLDPPTGSLRRELGIGPATAIVAVVARLVPIKAIDVFLAAVARIDPGRDVRFLIAGDGPERPRLQAAADALDVRERVTFLGWRSDLPALYGDTDVVVLTSHNEGTPVSVIEALAASRAVVATAVGGVPDVLDGCGVLVADRDVDALAHAIEALLDDPERRAELGRKGRAQAYPAYDASTLLARIDALYQTLAAVARVR